MFVAGHALLAVVSTSLLVPEIGVALLLGCLILPGAYDAATDGC